MLMVNVGSPAGMDNVFNRNDLEMIIPQEKLKTTSFRSQNLIYKFNFED